MSHYQTFSAFLAALDYDHPQGSSPAMNPDYACRDCPSGSPLRYVLFPQSELGRTASVHPAVVELWLRQYGDIDVMVNEAPIPDGSVAGTVYALDKRLDLRAAEVTETYVTAHNKLRVLGTLDHSLDRKRESAALRMMTWSGSRFIETRRAPAR